MSGDVRDDAERRAVAVIAPFQAADNLLGTLAAITNLARLQVLQGRLHAAAATYREMTRIASRPDEPLLLEGPAYYAGMGDLLREWNELNAAKQHLAQAMEQLVGRLVVDAEDVALGYLALARLQHARGNDADAQRTLETYTDLARQRGFVAHLIARGVAAQAQTLIHADINPSNVLVQQGTPYFIDWQTAMWGRSTWICRTSTAPWLRPSCIAALWRRVDIPFRPLYLRHGTG